MEFHVAVVGAAPDVAALDAAFRALDPAAVVDFDPSRGQLRIAAAMGPADVGRALAQAGHPVPDQAIEQQASVCCGGCSG